MSNPHTSRTSPRVVNQTRLEARYMLGWPLVIRARFFKRRMLQAMMTRTQSGLSAREPSTESFGLSGAVVVAVPRPATLDPLMVTVVFQGRCPQSQRSAQAVLKLPYEILLHRRFPAEVTVTFPDDFVGLQQLLSPGAEWQGLRFNTQPGQRSLDLSDAMSMVASAFDHVEAAHEVERSQAPLVAVLSQRAAGASAST